MPTYGYNEPEVDAYLSQPGPEPGEDDDGERLDCTHCGGSGVCSDGADPLDDCPDRGHSCHACGGSGDREDQVIF